MYFLFASKKVRCFACGRPGMSRIRRLDQALFLVLLVLTAMSFLYVPEGRYRKGWILWLALALMALFRRRAHVCKSCGSEFVQNEAELS